MVQKWDIIDYEILLKLINLKVHIREMARELGIPKSTISRRLDSLRKRLIVDYYAQGRNRVYFLKKNILAQKMAIAAETYKLLQLLWRHPFMMPVFQDIIEKSRSRMIILFGSYAKGNETKDSDIDIYIETTNEKIKSDIEMLNDNLSIKIGKFNTGSLLIKEIIKNHVIIMGAEDYYEKTKFFSKAQ